MIPMPWHARLRRAVHAGGEGHPAQQVTSDAPPFAGQVHRRLSLAGGGLAGLGIAAGAIIAVWSIAVTWRMAADVVAPWDSKNQFYAFFRFLAAAIHSGSTPFWNPYHYGGHPSIADPQSLVFAPVFLLWALFDPVPSMRAFDLAVYLQLLAGGLAVCAIGWRAGWPSAACVLAAVVFMFGACASSRMQHTGTILTYAQFPVALLLLQLALQRRSIALAVLGGIVAAMLILGRNQIAVLFCFVLAAATVREFAIADNPRRYLAERAPVLAVMAVTAAVLVAAPALLTIQFAALSNRPQAVLERALEASLYPANLATMLVPNIFGSHEFPPWGPNYETEPAVAAVDSSFNYLFVGAVPVVLLLWFGVAGGGLWRRGRLLLSAILIVALAYMLGRYTPVFPLAFEWAPGVGLFRRPIDGSFVFLAALAILAGYLLTDYVRDGLPRRRLLLLGAVIVAALAILAWAVVFSARSGRAASAAFEILRMAPFPLIAVAVLVLGRRTATARQWAAAAAVALAAGELLWWNASSRMNAEHSRHYAVLERPSGEDAEVLRLLEDSIRERQRNGERPRVEIMGVGGAWQNAAMVRGLEAINGYNPLRIGLYDRLVAPGETTYLSEQRTFPPTFSGYDSALARALGLEYVVLDRPIEQVPNLKKRPVAELLHDGPKLWLYRLGNPMPRLMFTDRVQLAAVEPLSLAGELSASPSSDRVLIDVETPPRGQYAGLGLAGGSARIVSWRPDRIEIEVDSQQGGMLVLHESYYPGWTAEIDGQTARILRADVLFRGVEVPAGRRTVVFRYAPLSFANLISVLRPPANARR
jgi:hypothetical protein